MFDYRNDLLERAKLAYERSFESDSVAERNYWLLTMWHRLLVLEYTNV